MVRVNARDSSCQHHLQLPLGIEPHLFEGLCELEVGDAIESTSPEAGVVMDLYILVDLCIKI